MKEAIVRKDDKVDIIDSPIPEPNDDQVLIKVEVSGSNPKDWKVPIWTGKELNQGDDIAGTVAKVGRNVTEFKVGDRVGAFHEMMTPHGSYAEYAVAWQHTTFHIAASVSYEQAAAVPLAAMTAAIGLYADQGLPQPWTPTDKPTPLIVYGAGSAVGSYAIQLAVRSGIHPILAVAGGSASHVEQFLDRSKGDAIIDYRKGDDAVVQGLKDALKGAEVYHAFDAVAEHNSYINASKVLAPGGKINLVLPGKSYEGIPENVTQLITSVGRAHKDLKDLAFVYYRYFGRGLHEGWFKAHPQEVIPGGLNGLQQGLDNLKDGKASAVKYVFRIPESDGAGKDHAS